jgi:peptidoglycan/LPS O-acetylase OafA/YrhL
MVAASTRSYGLDLNSSTSGAPVVSKKSNKLAYIDALRGIAILGVVAVHAAQHDPPAQGWVAELMATGQRGVQLFFVASALTLCMSWFRRKNSESRPVLNFFIRRFFRIAPMFYLGVVLYLLLYGSAPRYWAPNGIDWYFVPITMMFLHGFHPETLNSVVPGGWSIAAEFGFYALLPLILTQVRSRRAALCFYALSLAVCAGWTALAHLIYGAAYPIEKQPLVQALAELNVFGQLPVFAVGIAAYYWTDLRIKRAAPSVAVWALMLLSAVAIPALWLGFSAALRGRIAFGASFGVLALLLGRYPVYVFVNPVITNIGRVSFSMYITHFALLDALDRLGLPALLGKSPVGALGYYVVAVGVTAGVSLLCFEAIEKPGISAGKRLIDWFEARAASEAATASPGRTSP